MGASTTGGASRSPIESLVPQGTPTGPSTVPEGLLSVASPVPLDCAGVTVSGTIDGAVTWFVGCGAGGFTTGCAAGCLPPLGLPRGGGICTVAKTGAREYSLGADPGKSTDAMLTATAPTTIAVWATTETLSKLNRLVAALASARMTEVSNICASCFLCTVRRFSSRTRNRVLQRTGEHVNVTIITDGGFTG